MAIAVTLFFNVLAVSESRAQGNNPLNEILKRMEVNRNSMKTLRSNITMVKFNDQLKEPDTTEGTVMPNTVTFDSTNFNQPKSITVTGVDDLIDDGDQPYTIITDPAQSSDSSYSGLNGADVSGTSSSLVPDAASVRTLSVPFTRGPLCAATACQEWIAHNGLEGQHGPLFPRFARSGEPVLEERLDSAYVAILCKTRLLDAGIADVSAYSAESLRRGYELENKTAHRR